MFQTHAQWENDVRIRTDKQLTGLLFPTNTLFSREKKEMQE